MRFINKIISIYRRRILSPEKYARSIGVKIGKDCAIHTRNFNSEPYLIEIGDNVQIPDKVCFYTHGGNWVLRKKYPKFDCFGKIKVGNNVYIGNNSIILQGCTIADNVMIAAGSVVTKSVPSGVIVGGNPARIIGKVEDYEKKVLPYNIDSKHLSPDEKRKFLLALDDDKFQKKDFLK